MSFYPNDFNWATSAASPCTESLPGLTRPGLPGAGLWEAEAAGKAGIQALVLHWGSNTGQWLPRVPR